MYVYTIEKITSGKPLILVCFIQYVLFRTQGRDPSAGDGEGSTLMEKGDTG